MSTVRYVLDARCRNQFLKKNDLVKKMASEKTKNWKECLEALMIGEFKVSVAETNTLIYCQNGDSNSKKITVRIPDKFLEIILAAIKSEIEILSKIATNKILQLLGESFERHKDEDNALPNPSKKSENSIRTRFMTRTYAEMKENARDILNQLKTPEEVYEFFELYVYYEARKLDKEYPFIYTHRNTLLKFVKEFLGDAGVSDDASFEDLCLKIQDWLQGSLGDMVGFIKMQQNYEKLAKVGIKGARYFQEHMEGLVDLHNAKINLIKEKRNLDRDFHKMTQDKLQQIQKEKQKVELEHKSLQDLYHFNEGLRKQTEEELQKIREKLSFKEELYDYAKKIHQEEIEEYKKQQKDHENQISRLTNSLKECQIDIRQKQRLIDQLDEQFFVVKKARQTMEENLKRVLQETALSDNIASEEIPDLLKAEIQRLEKEKQDTTLLHQELETNISRIQQDAREMQADLTSALEEMQTEIILKTETIQKSYEDFKNKEKAWEEEAKRLNDESEATKESLQKQIDLLETEKAQTEQLQADLEARINEMSQLETQKNNLQKLVAEKDTELKSVSEKLEDQRQKMEEINTARDDEKEAAKASLQEQIDLLETEKAQTEQLQADLEARINEMSQLETQKNNLQKLVAEKDTELKSVSEQLENQKKEIEEINATLEASKTRLQEQKNLNESLEQKIQALNDKSISQEQKITALEATNQILEEQKNLLQVEKEAREQEIQTLKTTLEDNKNVIEKHKNLETELQENIAKQNEEITDLKEKIAKQQQDLNDERTKNDQMETENKELKNKLTELQGQIDDAQAGTTDNGSQIDPEISSEGYESSEGSNAGTLPEAIKEIAHGPLINFAQTFASYFDENMQFELAKLQGTKTDTEKLHPVQELEEMQQSLNEKYSELVTKLEKQDDSNYNINIRQNDTSFSFLKITSLTKENLKHVLKCMIDAYNSEDFGKPIISNSTGRGDKKKNYIGYLLAVDNDQKIAYYYSRKEQISKDKIKAKEENIQLLRQKFDHTHKIEDIIPQQQTAAAQGLGDMTSPPYYGMRQPSFVHYPYYVTSQHNLNPHASCFSYQRPVASHVYYMDLGACNYVQFLH